MPNYSKLHDLVSHRVTIEYDTGARVTGYLASCQPSSGPVEFVTLSDAKMIDSRGRLLRDLSEVTLCPNVLTSIALDEGPRGRDVAKRYLSAEAAAEARDQCVVVIVGGGRDVNDQVLDLAAVEVERRALAHDEHVVAVAANAAPARPALSSSRWVNNAGRSTFASSVIAVADTRICVNARG